MFSEITVYCFLKVVFVSLLFRTYVPTKSETVHTFNVMCGTKRKSNLHCTRGITPKRVTSSGVHLRGLAPGQNSFEETSQMWRTIGDCVRFDRTGNRTPDLPHR